MRLRERGREKVALKVSIERRAKFVLENNSLLFFKIFLLVNSSWNIFLESLHLLSQSSNAIRFISLHLTLVSESLITVSILEGEIHKLINNHL